MGTIPEPTRVQVRLKPRLLPLLLILLVGTALLWAERVWMMLLIAAGGIWLLDFVWARSLARGLGLKRELRYGWAQVGDELEERFTLIQRGSLPALWVEIIDHSTLPDYQASVATGVQAASQNTWSVRHVCARRGIFSLGPTTVRSGTPFGLYAVELTYDARAALMVMPPIVPLPNIQVAPGGSAHEGRRRASAFERTVNASGVRAYLPGDPFPAIHWRAVAHHDELCVRTFESTPAGDWWIWLDLDRDAQAGAGEHSTVEHAVILAASLAERGLRSGHAVGLAANAHAFVWLTPAHSASQRLQILRALAEVEPGTRPLGEVLARTRQPAQASVILITAAVEGAWLDALAAWTARGARPTVLLLDRTTYGGAESDKQFLSGTQTLLANSGIPHSVITRDLLDRPEARPGREGHWEWKVGATGRAIARDAPHDQVWRTLG